MILSLGKYIILQSILNGVMFWDKPFNNTYTRVKSIRDNKVQYYTQFVGSVSWYIFFGGRVENKSNSAATRPWKYHHREHYPFDARRDLHRTHKRTLHLHPCVPSQKPVAELILFLYTGARFFHIDREN